jgi:hypothetical protein
VCRHVFRIVPAGIDMAHVRNMPGRQQFVQSTGSSIKAEVILVAAVEINFQPMKIGRSRINICGYLKAKRSAP